MIGERALPVGFLLQIFLRVVELLLTTVDLAGGEVAITAVDCLELATADGHEGQGAQRISITAGRLHDCCLATPAPGASCAPLALPIPGSLEVGKALLGHVRRFGFWIRLYDVLKRPAGRLDIHEFYLAIGH